MRGVFKRAIVGDEVRYGMEFSLEMFNSFVPGRELI
jgi:hypothetical protein